MRLNYNNSIKVSIIFVLALGICVGLQAETKYPTNTKESRLMSLVQNRLLKPFNNRANEMPPRNYNQLSQEIPLMTDESVDTVWVRHYSGPGGDDSYPWTHAIAVDNAGNVYVGGASYGIGTERDYTVIKYDSTGNEKWVARYDLNNGTDVVRAMTIDDLGNVYVTGISGPLLNNTLTTIKYNSNGDTVWVRGHIGPGGFINYGSAITVDDSGSVYVTGFETGVSLDGNCITIKYDKRGDQIWQAIYDTPGTDMDLAEGMDIALDNAGNIYVGGYYTPDLGYTDYLIIKYSPAGETLWTRLYNGIGDSWDQAEHIAVDDSGNCCVSGYCDASFGGANYEIVTQKYNPDGDLLWSSEPMAWISADLQIDNNGGIVVAGTAGNGNGIHDYITIKHNASNGDTIWARTYNGPDNWNDYAWDMAIDNDDNIYVTGNACGPVCEKEYGTVKYDSVGNQIWGIHYYHPQTYGYNIAFAIAVDNSGYVYVTGECDLNGGSDGPITTIKYKQLPVGVQEQSQYDITNNIQIMNPVTSQITVYFSGKQYANIEFSLYNVSGRLVKNLDTNLTKTERQINIPANELSNGIYFLRIHTAKEDQVLKVVKVR